MLKPLIKYAGGKYKEYDNIKQYFPDVINNYYEPFFGGGGVFFRLVNENKISNKAYVNDYSESLIEFYRSVANDDFEAELNKISDAWDLIRDFSENMFKKYGNDFFRLMTVDKDEEFVNDDVKAYITEGLKDCNFNFHGFSLQNRIEGSLKDKLSRFRKKEIDKNNLETSYKSLTTCICQAFYFVIRDMYNDWNNHGHKDNYTQLERSAQWFFIREYCFGSMFRFGPNGDFNVPYGGYSYNSKCFSSKIENIVSNEAKTIFKNLNVSREDFEKVIDEGEYEDDDFMFLDPPYDSTFTDYDDNSFGKKDHIRLANCLKRCKCKWLIAIGKTDFIYDLYKDYNIIEYEKTYMYQARGEYDNKHTTHLIITNY